MPVCLMLDVDGVLVNGCPADSKIWTHRLFEDLGIGPDLLVQEFFARAWQDVVTGKRDLHPALSSSLSRLDTNVTAEELIAYWFENDSCLSEQVLADCRAARRSGSTVYLATNQEHLRARYLMETLGLARDVDGMIYSAEVGFQKPNSAFFDYATAVAGCRRDDILLVDDTLANVAGARKAGWRAAHWDGRERLSDILRRTITP